jgi:hypothetical protein
MSDAVGLRSEVCAEAPREPTVLRKPATDATHTRVTHILLNLVLSLLQHDPPNRPATDALDAGDEFRLARPPQPLWRIRSRMARIGM